MAATKTCPSCGADVPASAARCKECFHDFTEAPKRSYGPLILLASFASMAAVGALVFWWITTRPIEERILVDEATQSVVFTTQYRDGPKTDRLAWSEITQLEHVTTSTGDFEVVAVTNKGERKTIQLSTDKSLKGTAEHYAALMNKPLVDVDNTVGGFGADH